MKRILSLLLISAMLTTACSKQSPVSDDSVSHHEGVEDNPNGGGGNNVASVPALVQAAFNSRYANASRVQWKKLSDGNYKAEFFRGAVKWQATFTPNGTLLKEEHN